MSQMIDEKIRHEIELRQKSFWEKVLIINRTILLFMMVFVVGWTFYMTAREFFYGLLLYTGLVFSASVIGLCTFFAINKLIAWNFIRKLDK